MNIVDASQLDLAARAIEAGELVVVPTARWYMLCCAAADPVACRNVFAGKRRPDGKSLLLVAPTPQQVRQWCHIPAAAERIISQLWPGDLALRLRWRDPGNAVKYAAVSNPSALVACVPGSLGELARRCATPVAATSANISGEAGTTGPGPAITLSEVRQFAAATGTKIAIGVDGGICPAFQHLTVVDATGDHIRVERDGAVSRRAVDAALDPDQT